MKSPLPVVLGAVVNKDHILLIKKNKSLFTDLWGMPSGKIQQGENIDKAIVRKLAEKAGLDAKYEGLLGLVSEVLSESGNIVDHFLIFLCGLKASDYSYTDSAEGKFR